MRRGGRRAEESPSRFEASNMAPADKWTCAVCTCSNPLRARSCEACGGKRSASSTAGVPAISGGRKRKGRDSDDSGDGESGDSGDSDEEDEEEGGGGEEEDFEGAASFFDFDELISVVKNELGLSSETQKDLGVRQLSVLRFLARDQRSDIFWEAVR